ncbi:MAG: MMPL family transporter [Thermomicrobiales bacterium]|nr:MMPL family transporter [Thermomicrobiales bacterium]
MSVLSTRSLARASAAHPWRVVVVWVAILFVALPLAATARDVVTGDWRFTGRPESVRAYDLMEDRLGIPRPLTETVVVTVAGGTIDDPAARAIVEQTTAELRALSGVVASVTNAYELAALGMPEAALLTSADRTSTLISVTLTDYNTVADELDAYWGIFERNGTETVRLRPVGFLSVNETINHISEEDLRLGEAIGIPIALVILVIVLGALLAAGMPLILAMGSIMVATGLSAAIGRVFDLSFYVLNMISLIGLAVGIDYALFIVERYREERRLGRDTLAAIETAGATASKAVLVSGITVVLALTGLFMLPTTIFTSLATGAILVVLVAVAAMLTLIPALLALFGDRINWPYWKRTAEPASGNRGHGFTAMLTTAVMRRPAASAALAGGLLALLAIPTLDIETGMAGVATLPESDVKDAAGILARDFQAGLASPVYVVIDGEREAALEAGVTALQSALAADADFGGQVGVQWSAAGDLALVTAPLAVDPTAPEAYAAVRHLRETTLPGLFAELPAEVLVTGESAYVQDYFQLSDAAAPKVFVFVLGLSFVLLLLAFRSIVVALKAILMNLLSVGAAYGLLVLVFQKGYLHGLLGFQQTPTIEAWLPIFLFCVLFGLSMDYHVFLLSRIREQFTAHGRNELAVASGLQSTARIITGAALIMVAVFSGFAAGRLVMFQQMGFGLAVAILLDATIVRSVLVPATMALLGNRNWYLPRWLQWLPDLHVEGSPAPSLPEEILVPSVAD